MVNQILALVGLILIAGTSQTYAAPQELRHYVVEEKALKASGLRAAPLAKDQGHTLLQLSAAEFNRIKLYLHENSMGCGGILDLTPYIDQRTSALDAFRMEVASTSKQPLAFDKQNPTFPEQTRQLLGYLKPERFRSYLTRLTTFPDRSAYSQNGLDAATYFATTAQALASQYGKTIEAISVPTGSFYRQPSTIIKVPGTRPELPGVVLGGHMDTFDNGKPGADDDASGSASVLEVLSAYLESPIALERTAYFMFYAAEERGLVGSSVVAKRFKTEGTQLRAVLQLDMTAYHPTDNPKMYFMQDNVDTLLSAFLEKLAIAYVGLTPDQIGRDRCGYACSDHASWTKNGYSAAVPFETAMSTYNPKIHTKDDTLAEVNWPHAEKFVRLAAAFLVETGDPVASATGSR